MKFQRALQIVQLDRFQILLWIVYAVILGIIERSSSDREVMFSIQPGPAFGFLLIYVALMGLTFFPSLRIDQNNEQQSRILARYEFLLTRAISRKEIFYARLVIYLLACLIPSLIVLGWVQKEPSIRLELPYYTLEERERTKEFYLTHFRGAYFEMASNDFKENKGYVILPRGMVELAWYKLLLLMVAALFAEFFIFLFWNSKNVQVWLFPIIVGLPLVSMMPQFRGGQSVFEYVFGWSQGHFFLSIFCVVLIGVAIQMFAMKRFEATEVIA